MGMGNTHDIYASKNNDRTSENATQDQDHSERRNLEIQRKITKELRLYKKRFE